MRLDRTAQHRRDESQDVVARLMAMDIVELLEVIDIGEDEAQGRRLLRHPIHLPPEGEIEAFAVRNPGQAVGHRLLLHVDQVFLQGRDFLRRHFELFLERRILPDHLLRVFRQRLHDASDSLRVGEPRERARAGCERGTEYFRVVGRLADGAHHVVEHVLQVLAGFVDREVALLLAEESLVDLRERGGDDQPRTGKKAVERLDHARIALAGVSVP